MFELIDMLIVRPITNILFVIYGFVGDFGLAIILFTILVKICLWPLAKRQLHQTRLMRKIQPELAEIKKNCNGNRQLESLQMMDLYKRNNIKPFRSMLTLLIQLPIFIALYGLLSTHYELRGAMFIPGWIPDLSVPDTVFTLPFNIPFLGNGIHVLPIIYTASMIYSMKVTQATSTQQTGQQGMMKFMTYGMPIIFFFILYNAPSGLILYWTVMNFISILQQMYVNKKKTKKYAQEIQEREEAKINKYKPTKKRK